MDLTTGGTPLLDTDTTTLQVVRDSLLSTLQQPRPVSEAEGIQWDNQKKALERIEQELADRGNVHYLQDKERPCINQEVDTYLEEELIALELKEKEADR